MSPRDARPHRVAGLPAGSSPWPGPARVLCTTRAGGISQGPWGTNNLGEHVQDDPAAVRSNRARLADLAGVTEVQWLDQVHGCDVLTVASAVVDPPPAADAMWTTRRGVALAIQSADCLPVVLADAGGRLVAAAHAGWRGLCNGVLASLLEQLPVARESLHAFIGPAISQGAYEVGPEVVQAFAQADFVISDIATAGTDDRWLLDLAGACRRDLRRLGVVHCTGGDWCTARDERFYSWRRETKRAAESGEMPLTGRQATLVWLPST